MPLANIANGWTGGQQQIGRCRGEHREECEGLAQHHHRTSKVTGLLCSTIIINGLMNFPRPEDLFVLTGLEYRQE